MTTKTQHVMGQPSWQLASDCVEAYLTETGGHLGPVTFTLPDGRCVEPYSIAPWAQEHIPDDLPAMLRVLRGDFFCMPFGGNDEPWQDEQHPPHGEVANAPWRLESIRSADGHHTLHASLDTTIRPGRVDKTICLVDGQPTVYQRHTIAGSEGHMCFGHHAMLRFPDTPASGIISTSPFTHGQVYVEPVETPATNGASSLQPGASFDDLEHVPLAAGGVTDLSRYPARPGFEDLVQLFADPSQPFTWTAVTFPDHGYLWYALKNPRVLASTILWISNGGRHYAPWNSRHTNVMGLEEVTSYFHAGLKDSVNPNALSQRGLKTAIRLDPVAPLDVSYVMGVASIPEAFDRVSWATPHDAGLTFHSTSGQAVAITVDLAWLSDPTDSAPGMQR